MKKNWSTPWLHTLDVEDTFAGPGLRNADEFNDDPDPEEADHFS